MLINKQKPFIFGLGAIFCLCFLFGFFGEASALSTKVKQVRTKDNPAVYFLYHAGHRKKAYLNADTYLNYGNKWSDVKFVSTSELNSWPEAKLIKKTDAPAVYYIKGSQKTLIVNWTDLEDFGLEHEPIITVNQTDLNQYSEATYEEIGLRKAGDLLVFSDPATSANANVLLTNTDGNLLGIFRFRSPASAATISSVTFDFGGLSGNALLGSAFVLDENGGEYNASVSVSQSRRQAVVTFRTPLALNAGEEKTIKLFLNILNCSCDNQTLRVELREAKNIEASITPVAEFPLRGTEFKILSGANILGQAKSQEESISSGGQNVSTGNRLLGKFSLTEETGHEDVSVKEIIFRNDGTAGKNDWEDFRLFSNGQIIARASTVASNNNIVFKVNYLRLKKGIPAVLTVVAALKSDYNTQATVNLQMKSLWAVGKTYSASLSPQINNLDETFTLN
jgi:hypothetical protein